MLLLSAKAGNAEAIEKLFILYRPLLLKESIVEGRFDEDLYQELCIVFCVVFMGFVFRLESSGERSSLLYSLVKCFY